MSEFYCIPSLWRCYSKFPTILSFGLRFRSPTFKNIMIICIWFFCAITWNLITSRSSQKLWHEFNIITQWYDLKQLPFSLCILITYLKFSCQLSDWNLNVWMFNPVCENNYIINIKLQIVVVCSLRGLIYSTINIAFWMYFRMIQCIVFPPLFEIVAPYFYNETVFKRTEIIMQPRGTL